MALALRQLNAIHKKGPSSFFLKFSLKLVSAIFYHLLIFIYHQMIALRKIWKMFFFHLKSSFRSRDVQVFVFLSSSLFLLVSHCFSSWSKKNLWCYDAINCISKSLVTHFVWYLKKEIGCGIEILSIIRVSNKEHFYGKIMQKMCSKSSSQTPF